MTKKTRHQERIIMTKSHLIEYMNGLSDESVVSVRVDLGDGLVFTSDPKTHDIVVDVHDPIESLAGQRWTEHEIQIEARKKGALSAYYESKKK